MSKVLDNKFKGILPQIISGNQSVFIEGRLITYNVIIAYEALHTMKVRQRGRVGSMALKLEMSKAYDRIEWLYLQVVLEKMGFAKRWINLMMKCVSSMNYSVLVNGEPGKTIKLSRWIRQWDTISPYLFILCMRV